MKTIKITDYRRKSYLKLLLLMTICGTMGKAYGQTKNEVSFHIKGLFSKLDYEVLQNKSDMGDGLSFGAGYSYYLSDNWSIGTGVELQYITGTAYVSSIEDSYTTVDMEGENFEFRYQAQDFSESQYANFLNIPVTIQYETTGITRFYAAGGLSVGFVLQSEYKAEASSLNTSGYYEQYDVELQNPKFAGFGDFGAFNTPKSELGLKTNLVLNLETGVKFMLDNNQALYMGLFADYGLRNLKPEENQQNLIDYNNENPMNFINNSLLSSTNNTASTTYVERVRTLALGLKIKYAFQL